MTKGLKPCPFCGGKAEIIKDEMHVWVHCTKCYSDTDLYQIQKEAVAAWNARPIESEFAGKIGKLESENKRLREALEFYAHGKHLWDADERDPACDAYDLVSGQVENGEYAREVLEGCAE